MNIVVLSGVVHRADRRVVGDDRRPAVELELRTVSATGASVTVPVVVYDRDEAPAIGEELLVRGTVRMRFYRRGPQTVARTEVVADALVTRRARARRRALLAGVRDELDA